MTAIAFLDDLRERRVELLLDPAAPSGLRYRVPRGVVTATVAERIRRTAPLLLPLLGAPKTPSDAPMPPEAPRIAIEAPMARLGTDVSPEPAATATETAIEEDELREQAQVSAVLLSAWRALWAGRLAVAAFEFGPGRWVTDPARWLQWAAKRRAYLLREHGPTWWDTDDGQILARDLYTFADWYEVVGLADPGEGAPIPSAPAARQAPHEPHAALF